MSVAKAKKTPDEYVVPLTEDHTSNPDYVPSDLLDSLTGHLKLKNDAALARALRLPPPVISKVRRKQVSMTAAILLRIHKITGWSIADLEAKMGIKPQFASL